MSSRVSTSVTQQGHGFVRGTPVRFDGEDWVVATTGEPGVGLVGSVLGSDSFEVVTSGEVTDLDNLTPGLFYYPDASGSLLPIANGTAVGQAISDRVLVVNPGGSNSLSEISDLAWSIAERANKLIGFDSGGALSLFDQASGSGTTVLPSSQDYVITDTEFGAIGDGSSHPLGVDEASAYNGTFGIYGASGAYAILPGDERDFAAMYCAMLKASTTGRAIFLPPGTYRINRPLYLPWTATPSAGMPATPMLCRIYGSGRASVLKGYGIPASRGVLELIGESNTYAVNCELSNFQVEEDASCNVASYCLRLGDGYCGINLHRIICKGAQALALRVGSSTSYAQICFLATQCQFWSNWELRWGADAGLFVYSVNNESLGSYWDSALFQACFFWGQCNPRAFTCKFETCMFIVPADRALNIGCVVYLGTCAWDNCYFEDHVIGIASVSITATVPITNIAIRNCHFSSANHAGPANAQSSIQCARDQAEHGPVTIESCRFGGTATYSDIDLYGPITVSVLRCCHPFAPINVAPTITTAGDVRLTKWNPNGENPYDLYTFSKVRIECPIFHGSSTFVHDVAGAAALAISNSDTGGTSTAAVQAISNDVNAQFVAYHTAHSILPGSALLGHDHATGPIILAPGNLPRLYVDHTYVKAVKSVDNTGYGYWAENTHAGANSYTFSILNNGTTNANMVLFGTGHALANQFWIYQSTNNPVIFGTNGVEECRVSDTGFRIQGNGRDGAYGLYTQNASVGTSAYTYHGISNGSTSANMLLFGSGHALANQFWVYQAGNNPLIFGVNSVEESRITDTGLRVQGAGRDGDYGITTKNPSTGVNAYGAIRVSQNQDKGIAAIAFGQNHALSGQSWIYSVTNDPLILGSNGVSRVRIDGAGEVRVVGTTSATSPTAGAFVVGDGSTPGDNTAIGNGNIYTGENITAAGNIIALDELKARDADNTTAAVTQIRLERGDGSGNDFEIRTKGAGSQDVGSAQFRIGGSDIIDVNLAYSQFLNYILAKASSTSSPSMRLPHGSAPSSPTDGDFWSTTGGFYGRVNGATVGPFIDASTAGATAAYYGKINSGTDVSITAATSASLNRMHVVSGTSANYDITISGLSPATGDVLGFYVKDYAAADKTYRLDAGGTVKIAGRTRYLTLVHTNVVLLRWDGTDWQPLVLNLDTPWVDAGAMTITAVTTNPTKGTISRDKVLWSRRGDRLVAKYIYHHTAAGSAGSGDYLLALPVGTFSGQIELDTSAYNVNSIVRYITNGYCGNISNNTTWGYAAAYPYGSSTFRVVVMQSSGANNWIVGSANWTLSDTTMRFNYNLDVPLTDW